MNLNQIVNSIIGRTSSTNVNIVEKVHFDGKHFKKVVYVEDSAHNKKIRVERMNAMFPSEAKIKTQNEGYRFCFRLDLQCRPAGMTFSELIDAASYNKNYSAYTILSRPQSVKIYGPYDDGARTKYLGYRLRNWLQIEPEHVINGEIDIDYARQSIKVFPVEFYNVYELYEIDFAKQVSQSISLRKEVFKVSESESNKFIQDILKREVIIFLKECSRMLSPK